MGNKLVELVEGEGGGSQPGVAEQMPPSLLHWAQGFDWDSAGLTGRSLWQCEQRMAQEGS